MINEKSPLRRCAMPIWTQVWMTERQLLTNPDSYSTTSCCSWTSDYGVPPEDRNSEIVVVINGYMLVNSQNRLRQRTYRIGSHVRFGYRFAPIVKHPHLSR